MLKLKFTRIDSLVTKETEVFQQSIKSVAKNEITHYTFNQKRNYSQSSLSRRTIDGLCFKVHNKILNFKHRLMAGCLAQ